MKTFCKSNPVTSFLVAAFTISYAFWSIPLFVDCSADIYFGLILAGMCGPLLSALLITYCKAERPIHIASPRVFLFVFIAAAIVLCARIYFSESIPYFSETEWPIITDLSPIGILIFLLVIGITALNMSLSKDDTIPDSYLSSALPKKENLKWYVIAVLLMPSMSVLSFSIGTILGLENNNPSLFLADNYWMLSFLTTLFFLGGNEEFGWRGYLQKNLQEKYRPLTSIFIISIIWSFWHLPLHFNAFYSTHGFMDFWPRLIYMLPLTIIFYWVYYKSNYSLFVMMLFHAMNNNYPKLVSQNGFIFVLFMFALCCYCIIDLKMWKKLPKAAIS